MKRLLIFFFLLASPAWGATYYVSNSGDNSSAGTDTSTAWETIGKACSTMTGGDSLLFMGGTYAAQGGGDMDGWTTTMLLTSSLNGSSSDPTVFKPAPEYGRPTIKGYAVTGYDASIESVMAVSSSSQKISWIVLDSLIVKLARRGIKLQRSSNITIQNCVACSTGGLTGQSNTGGVIVDNANSNYTDSLIVDACSLYNNWEEIDSGGGNHGQIQTYGTRWSSITNNVMFGGYQASGMVFIKGERNHAIEIAYNTIYGNTYGTGVGISLYIGNDSMMVHHNVIYGVKKAIEIIEWTRAPEGNVGHKIYNNTIFNLWKDSGDDPAGGIIFATPDNGTGGEGTEIFNNIIVNVEAYDNLRKESDFTIKNDDKYIDYNNYYNSDSIDVIEWDGTRYTIAEARASLNIDSFSCGQYPIFADTANKDFSLTGGTSDSITSGGRGNGYPSYMGAMDPGDTTISQVITCIDTTTTSLQIVDNFTLSNTVVDSVIFECSDDNWSSVVKADTIGNPTDPDTSSLSGLSSNTEYKTRCRAWDTSESITDTSNVLTITTDAVGISHSLSFSDTNNVSLTVVDDYSGDSGIDTIIFVIDDDADIASPLDADTILSEFTDPDSATFAGLVQNDEHWCRSIIHDDAGWDTSSSVNVYTLYTVAHSLTAIDTTATTVNIKNDYAANTVDTCMLLWDTDSDIAGHIGGDTITAGITDPDTLPATGLSAETPYWFWWILHDQLGRDTSSSITVTTEAASASDSLVFNNDTDIIDSWIKSNEADVNKGSLTNDFIYDGSGVVYRHLINFQNLNDSIGAGRVIDSALFYWVCANGTPTGDDRDVFFYGMWNPYWVEDDTGSSEGGVTYNDWSSPDSEWATAGVNCAYNAGTFNSWDDTDCSADSADRQSTYLDSLLIPTGSTVGDTFVAYITAWIDTCYRNDVNPSILMVRDAGSDNAIYSYSRENASHKPHLVVYHSGAGGEPAPTFIRIRK